MRQAAAELGHGFGPETRAAFIGRDIVAWRDTLTRLFGADYPRFRDRRRRLWERHVREVGVARKAGLSELLNQLEEDGLRTAVATSSRGLTPRSAWGGWPSGLQPSSQGTR